MEGLSPADNEIYLEFVAGIIIETHHLPVWSDCPFDLPVCIIFLYFSSFFILDNVVKTLSALKVSTSAKSVKIKLTKKLSTPCLTFEIDLVNIQHVQQNKNELYKFCFSLQEQTIAA